MTLDEFGFPTEAPVGSSLDWCRICTHIRWYHGLVLLASKDDPSACLSCKIGGRADAVHEFRMAA